MVGTAQSSQSNWYFRVLLPGDGSRVNSVVIFLLPARKPRSHRCCPDGDFHTTPNDDFSTRYLTFCFFLFVFGSFLRVFSLKITLKILKTAPHRKYAHTFEKLKRNDCFLSMTMETHFVTNSALKKSVFECSRKDILLADFVRHFEFMLNLAFEKF